MQDPSQCGDKQKAVASATTDQLQSRIFPQTVNSAPLDWLLDPGKSRGSLINRVLARLVQLEAHEPDAHLRDDYRQSFIAISLAVKYGTPKAGEDPRRDFIEASFIMYGIHPDRLWDAIQERR